MNEPFENEGILTEYLLGGLSEDTRAQIEQRFFADEHFEELLQAMEQELIYGYAQGGLTAAQREKFEKTFLRSAENRQRLEVARVLLQRLSAKPHPRMESSPASLENMAWWQSLLAGSRIKKPLAAVYAAAALLLIASVIWLVLSRNGPTPRGPQNQAAQHPPQTGSPSPQGQNPPVNSQAANSNSQAPANGNPDNTSHLAALVLALEPGQTRDGGAPKQLILSPQAQSLSIQLSLHLKPDGKYTAYQAVLLNPDEKTVWTKTGLHPTQSSTGHMILLAVPTQNLSPDDYKITLSGQTSGGYQDIADYYFSVRHP